LRAVIVSYGESHAGAASWLTRAHTSLDVYLSHTYIEHSGSNPLAKVCSCGWVGCGQLGHGDTADKLVLTLVGVEGFRGAQIIMVVAGGVDSID